MVISKKEFKTLLLFFLSILVLIFLTSYAFRDMLKMIVWGQGFEYLLKHAQDSFRNNLPHSLANYEISAVLLGALGYKFFGLNFPLYYWTWLVITLVVSILIFFLTYILTGKRWVAFSAALMNGVCYASQMGLIGWVDTTFIGRVPNLILLIPSFIFLHLFLKWSKLKFYLISILLFFLGSGLGQFGLLLGFFYILYPLLWFIFLSSGLIKSILISASFAAISVFFVKIHSAEINPQGPSYSFTYFLLRPRTYRYLEKIPLQLAHWSNYPNLAKGIYLKANGLKTPIFGYKGTIREHFTDLKANKEAVPGVAIVYLLAALLIYFRLPRQRPLLFTIIFGTAIMLIQNVYFNHYRPEEQAGASRYLLYPTIWLSVFWSLFLWAAFWKGKSRWLKIFGAFVLGGYYLVNTALIQDNLNEMLYAENSAYRRAIKMFAYIDNIRPNLKPNTLVITPSAELDCSADLFLNERLGKEEVVFWPLNASTSCLQPPKSLEKVISSSTHVIRLIYDQNCDCVAEEKIK